ncbi:acyl carrier protein [Sphaerisporangium dianthi]|uniref:Acyl carrier protein n=1 Tax=Sphaerisporangium dianthi TaxID=1436120 RepID=A0ABV9CT03_9ACTN
MTAEERVGLASTETDTIEDKITRFVAAKAKVTPAVDQDLISTGLVTSMFAMQLVVFLEQTFSVVIAGSDLQLVNFRTVEAMVALVRKLRGDAAGGGNA